MKKISFLLLLVMSLPPTAMAQLPPATDPYYAVVRIKSHGASGTIIQTDNAKSYILSCAHMFFHRRTDQVDQALVHKPFMIDGPDQPSAPRKIATTHVVAIDPNLDLSLLVIDNGPFNYVPVAPRGFTPGRNTTSAGFDNMSWPFTHQHATIWYKEGSWTYTQEKPWHGRSGGGLFDLDAHLLIGVVNGYEVGGRDKGIYAGHESVLRFLASQSQAPSLRPQISTQRYQSPQQPMFLQPCPNGQCPISR